MSRQLGRANVESKQQSTLVSAKSVKKPISSLPLQLSQQKSTVSKQTSSLRNDARTESSLFDNETEKSCYNKASRSALKTQEAVKAAQVTNNELTRHLETSTYLTTSKGLVNGFDEPKSQISSGSKNLKSMSVGEQLCRKQLMQRHLSVIEAMELLDLDADSEMVKQAIDQLFQQNTIRPPTEIEVWIGITGGRAGTKDHVAKKRAIRLSSGSDKSAVSQKKKRVSWATKLEHYQGEEVVVEAKVEVPKAESSDSDMPVDKIEDVNMESSSSEDEEDTDANMSTETPAVDDEIGEVKPKKVKAVKEKKEYKKFDYKTAVERTLFVGNVPYNTKAVSLKKLFTPYGKIEAIYKRSLLQKTEKLTKKMFGTDKELKTIVTDAHIYVRFETEESAKKACELNGTEFKDRNLRVTLSTDKSTDPARSLFVGNLPYKISEQSLMEFFEEKAGDVESVRIVHDKDSGLGKGYGFVTFKKAEQIRKALDVLQGQRFKGRQIRLTKMAKKKNRPVAGALHTKGKMQQAKVQRGERELKNKLANYTVTKKTFSKVDSETSKFSKTAIKNMKKRKSTKLKKKSLLS